MGAVMAFRVGQEAVCVDDDFKSRGLNYLEFPVKGRVYIIEEIFNEGQSLTLRGMAENKMGGRAGFYCRRFRPIVKTDISLLEEIARKVTQGERVDA